MHMEIEAVAAATRWLVDEDVSHGIVVVDSQSVAKEDWEEFSLDVGKPVGMLTCEGIKWIFYPGHAGVHGNDMVDRLAGQAEIQLWI